MTIIVSMKTIEKDVLMPMSALHSQQSMSLSTQGDHILL